MTCFKEILSVLALTALASHTAANAQDQTAEGAQLFLTVIAEDNQLTLESDIGLSSPVKERVTRVGSSDICTSELVLKAIPTRGFVGMTIRPTYPEEAGGTAGLGEVVVQTLPGGPADKAGITAGDIVLAIGPNRVTPNATLSYLIANTQPGSTVPFQIKRGDQTLVLQVSIEGRPSESSLSPATTGPSVDSGSGERVLLIDWSRARVSAAPAQAGPGAIADLSLGAQSVRLRFGTPDEGLQKRTLYALQFLKESCDRTAATGF